MLGMMHEMYARCNCWGFLDVLVGMRRILLPLMKLFVGMFCIGMLMIDMMVFDESSYLAEKLFMKDACDACVNAIG